MAAEYEAVSSSDEESLAAEDTSDCVDAFPSKIYDVQDFHDLRQLFYWSTVIESIKTAKSDAIPVIPFKMQYYCDGDENRSYHRIVFMNLVSDRALLWDRFDRLYDEACYKQVKTGHEDVDWHLLDRKLLKNPRLSHRFYRQKMNKSDGLYRKGNADNRQSYVLRHMFLVKQHVTPGAKTTGQNECHLYQIYHAPLMVYLYVGPAPVPEDGSFYANTRHYYQAYLLQPYKAYVIGPGKTYISMSLQKTCYAVLRATTSAVETLRKHYTIQDAFVTAFVPKTPAELDEMVSQRPKRKRGRPTKSLDKMYWYKTAGAQQQQQRQPEKDNPPPPQQKRQCVVVDEPSEQPQATVLEDVPILPAEEIDPNFIEALTSPDPKDIDNYLGTTTEDEIVNWLNSFTDSVI